MSSDLKEHTTQVTSSNEASLLSRMIDNLLHYGAKFFPLLMLVVLLYKCTPDSFHDRMQCTAGIGECFLFDDQIITGSRAWQTRDSCYALLDLPNWREIVLLPFNEVRQRYGLKKESGAYTPEAKANLAWGSVYDLPLKFERSEHYPYSEAYFSQIQTECLRFVHQYSNGNQWMNRPTYKRILPKPAEF